VNGDGFLDAVHPIYGGIVILLNVAGASR